MARIHLSLGAKGGIGKSFIAAVMAQYLTGKHPDKPPRCIDLDFKNRTFAKFQGLDVTLIDLETEGDIERRKFDTFVKMAMAAVPEDVFVVDTGSNIYLTMMNYLIVNGIADMLLEHGDELILHVPIMGGQELNETLETLEEVMAEMPEGAPVAVWINQFNGLVEKNGKSFEQSEIYRENIKRIRSICYIPKWRVDMARDVSEMLKARVTFDVAMKMDSFDVIERQRLRMAQYYLYQAMEQSRVCR